MLVLTRKVGESFQIGKDIKIAVLTVKGSSIRIGIDAPKNIPVWRTGSQQTPKAEETHGSDR